MLPFTFWFQHFPQGDKGVKKGQKHRHMYKKAETGWVLFTLMECTTTNNLEPQDIDNVQNRQKWSWQMLSINQQFQVVNIWKVEAVFDSFCPYQPIILNESRLIHSHAVNIYTGIEERFVIHLTLNNKEKALLPPWVLVIRSMLWL